MSLIVYAAENPFVSLVSIMLTFNLAKDIYDYVVSPYVITNIFSLFHRFYVDSLYISDSMKALTLPYSNYSHPFVNAIFNIVSVQITSLLYVTEIAIHTMIKTAIMMFDLSTYIITGAEKTYNNVQLYLSYEPVSYSLDDWLNMPKEYSFDFTAYYDSAMAFLAACSIFAVYRWIAKKVFNTTVQVKAPVKEEEKSVKEEKKLRRSPRLAMLYLTDHSFSSRR